MPNYKISNVPRYLNHKGLKLIIEKETNLQSLDFKLKYILKKDYAIIIAKKEIEISEINIKKNICKITILIHEKIEKEININLNSIDVRDSTTELWKMNYNDQIIKKKKEIETFYNKEVEIIETSNFFRNNCQFAFGFNYLKEVELGFRCKNVGDYNLVFGIENCLNVSDRMKNQIKIIKKIIDNKKEFVFDRIEKKGFFKMMMIRESKNESICLLQINDENNLIENKYFNKNCEKNIDHEELCIEKRQSNYLNENIINKNDKLDHTQFKGNEILSKFFILIEKFPFDNLYLQFNNSNFEGFAPSKIYKIRGNDFFIEEINSYKFKISFFSFFQINTDIAEKILIYLNQKESKNDILYDLCCGSGFFGILLNKKFKKIIGVEINEECIKDANYNIKLNDIKNYEVVKADVEKKFFCEEATVVLDPPRNGVSKKTIANIRKNSKINEIFYISCNYKAANQNIVDLCKPESNMYKNNAFTIENIKAFDMFPNTDKIEIVLHLIRK